MCTRSSRAASSAGDGARICTGVETGVGCDTARSIAFNMSPLVTCPCRPVPLTFDGSTPLSAAIFRTEGGSGISRGCGCSGPAPMGLVLLVFSSVAPVGLAAGFMADGIVAGFGCAPAPSLICPSNAPTATVSPFFTAMSDRTPAAGAGTSSVTLSVSSSTSGSSTATASPACLNHFPTVASVTDSPRVGTRISAMTSSILFCHESAGSAMTECDRSAKRFIDELLELCQMLRHLPDRGRGRCRAPRVAHGAVLGADLVENPLQENIDEEPSPHIARLFLAPDHFRLFEARELGDQRFRREWI